MNPAIYICLCTNLFFKLLALDTIDICDQFLLKKTTNNCHI